LYENRQQQKKSGEDSATGNERPLLNSASSIHAKVPFSEPGAFAVQRLGERHHQLVLGVPLGSAIPCLVDLVDAFDSGTAYHLRHVNHVTFVEARIGLVIMSIWSGQKELK
jgi:hypothetical protein